jgi:hypothetical protein
MKSENQSFGIIDFIIYASALWYFIVQLSLGPLVRAHISKKLWIAEMGRLLFFYNDELGKELNLTEKVDYKSDAKVKIQID